MEEGDKRGEVHIRSEGDIITCRKTIRLVATPIGFGVTDMTRIVTAVSELARNIYVYAGTGRMIWNLLEQGSNRGVEVIFKDEGTGISNVEQAMTPGFSSGGGMGMGLPGVKRLMDRMDIETGGKGTTITIQKWLGRRR